MCPPLTMAKTIDNRRPHVFLFKSFATCIQGKLVNCFVKQTRLLDGADEKVVGHVTRTKYQGCVTHP